MRKSRRRLACSFFSSAQRAACVVWRAAHSSYRQSVLLFLALVALATADFAEEFGNVWDKITKVAGGASQVCGNKFVQGGTIEKVFCGGLVPESISSKLGGECQFAVWSEKKNACCQDISRPRRAAAHPRLACSAALCCSAIASSGLLCAIESTRCCATSRLSR